MKIPSSALLSARGSGLVASTFSAVLCVLTVAALLPSHLDAQDDSNRFRLGFTIAGTSLVALVVEHQWGDQALEVTVGTFSFRDVSLSVVGKQYFSGGSLRPFAGAGLWTVVAFAEERTGAALIFRAPVGTTWQFTGDHFLGTELNVNRALLVRRTDPEDFTPPRASFVPIPGLFYRYGLEPR